MKQVDKKYQCIPFWSWNDELDEQGLVEQIEWMNENGVGGFFMHARGGLKTEYLGEKWFSCVKACCEKAEELGMEAYAYDENGWPSGFVGGKLLEDIENHDRYLTHAIGAFDEKALVSYAIDGDKLVRTQKETGAKEYLNVYQHYATSTADVLNPEVIDQFLAQTHEEYHKRDTYSLKGFFTDEPQYYRWGVAYTKVVAPYFEKEYGQDILDGLGLLFVEKEGYRDFRYKYWKAMQSLMLENFGKRIYDWCDERGYKLTGHYVEETSMATQLWCCGGIMPFYEYEHIPGIDYLGNVITGELAGKQVASACAQLGKKQILTETYGCCGWDVSPIELKMIAESQYVAGVNLMCQHLLPYTEHGQRKRDYPAHYSSVNPWVRKNFKQFNDYFSVLGMMIAESEEQVNVGILHPMRSTYFGYQRFPDGDGYGVKELDQGLENLLKKLSDMHLPHHLLDETLMARHARVEGKTLVVGNCRYDYVILPLIYTMDKTTDKLLQEFVKAGGRVLLTEGKPTYLEGQPHVYDYLESNVTYEEMLSAQPYGCKCDGSDLRSCMRMEADGKKFIYVVNLGEETTAHFTLKDGTSFLAYDILKDEYVPMGLDVHFDRGESYVLYVSEEAPKAKKALKPLRLGKEFTVCGAPENYLTLDFVAYSTDGKTYSEPLHHMGVFDEMLKRRYQGDLYLKYTFNVDVLPTKCVLLAEDTNTKEVCVNGVKVAKCGHSEVEKPLSKYDVAALLKTGENEVVITIRYFQSEQVYYALFGENVTESLKNCLAYDTDIEAVALKGNFAVYGDFEPGARDGIVLGQNFRLGAQKKQISALIEEGYPFFSGNITLKQTVTVQDTDYELVLDKRFHLVDVQVNGKDVGRMMFSERLDLSDYLQVGENELVITLTVGCRNLLGPFHAREEEPRSVGPYTFERFGTWKDGKSSILRESYAFVKTIL